MDSERELIMLKAELAATRQAADILGLAWLQTIDLQTGLTVEEGKIVATYSEQTEYMSALPDRDVFDGGVRQLVSGAAAGEGLRLLTALGGFAAVHERAVVELQELERLLPTLPESGRGECRLVMAALLHVLGLGTVPGSRLVSRLAADGVAQ